VGADLQKAAPLLLLLALGCGASHGATGGPTSAAAAFTIKVQLASDIQSTAPTTVGIVTWSLNRPGLVGAHIDFGLDASYGMTAPVDLAQPDHRTVLIGMKPARTYHFQIVGRDASQTYTSGDQTLVTGPLPADFPIGSFSVQRPGAADTGFIIGSFWTTFSPSIGRTVFIIDTDGDYVWWYSNDNAGDGGSTQGIARARLSANNHDVWLIDSDSFDPLHRVSLDTLDAQAYPHTAGSHDVCAVDGDTMAYIGYTRADTIVGTCDRVIEIDKAGTTKEVFDSTPVTGSGCHGNAIRYAAKQDQYVFSDRLTDVFVLDRSGALQWKLSDKVAGGNASWGGMQHGVQLLDASLLIFANQAGGEGHSQAIEYGLDGSVIKKFTSRGGTDNLGDVQRLSNGNTFINYSGLLQEVDPDDNVLLEMTPPSVLGYTEFRQNLYGPALDTQS
jgi:hypothetical protein